MHGYALSCWTGRQRDSPAADRPGSGSDPVPNSKPPLPQLNRKLRSMLTVDISLPEIEEIQKLVQEGTEKGFLSYDEIASGLEEVELTKEQIEDFYTYLADHTIELVEGEKHKHPPHEERLPEEDPVQAAKNAKLDLTVEP